MKNTGIEKLKKLLEEKQITQLQAGIISGVPQPTISRHISGDRLKVDPEIAIKYEKAFGIPKEDFVFLNG
jgi:DNA transposition AAA+ family ATPase